MKTTPQGRKITLVLLVVLVMLLFILSGLAYFRIDLTRDKKFSVSQVSKHAMESVTEPLRITYYLSKDLENFYPQTRDVKDADGGNGIQKGVFPRQIQSAKENRQELVTVYSSIVMEYLNRMAVIPFIVSGETLEYELTSRLMQLTDSAQDGTVFVMTGNGLSVDTDYSYVKPWLSAAGFVPVSVTPEEFLVSLEDSLGSEKKPPILLLGTSALEEAAVEGLKTYVEFGGSIFVTTSSNSADVYGTWDAYPVEAGADVFLPVLADWGIEVGPELVFDISCYRVTLVSNDENPVYEYLNYPLWISSLPQYTTTHQISKNVTDLQFFWSSPLNLTKSGDPLVYTTPNSWLEAPDFSKEQPFVANPFMVAQSAAQAGKESGQYLLSALVSVDGGGKVMAVSSQYFVSTLMLDYTGAYTNLEYVDVPAETLISILKKTGSAEQTDFDSKKYISCIKALQEKRPTIKCRLIVRVNRDISKGTGTLLSPTDRKLGDKFNDDITLTIYRVNGSTDKGWDGMPNWIPNIKFPDGICFYDIVE